MSDSAELRRKNRKILEKIRDLKCLACGIHPCEAVNVVSNGVDPLDLELNLMPLCRDHANYMQKFGIEVMFNAFPFVWRYLSAKGWTIEANNIYHPKVFGKDQVT